MGMYAETVNVTNGCRIGASNPRKEQWIQQYADRMLNLWTKWQTSLGVACNYVEQLKEDLADLYEEPLKRIFIERTY